MIARRPLVAAWLPVVAVVACGRVKDSADAGAPSPVSPPASLASPSAPASASAGAPTSPAPSTLAVAGEATLILQRVERHSACGRDLLGFDLLVETKMDEAGAATRRHVFCPPDKKNMFEMCRTFKSCGIESDDADAPDRTAVRCDRETFVIESTPKGTRITGPKVDLEVSPSPLRVLPPKRVTRIANVDC